MSEHTHDQEAGSADREGASRTALLRASDEAVRALKELLAKESPDADGVRVGVKGGGCSGLSYRLEFGRRREGDHVLEQDGVTFLMDRKSSIYLKGVVLEYRDGLSGKGFVFRNPNVTNTCGCGESFSM